MKWINQLILLTLSMVMITLSSGCNPTSSDSSGEDQNDQEMQESDGVSAGEPAPDFTLTSLEGTQYTLSDLQGKVVYIFFFGAECPHCIANGPATESKIYQPYKNNSNFVALGLDTWDLSTTENTQFKNVTGITYTLLLKAQMTLVDYYGNSAYYDRSVVIGSDGTVVYKGTGYVNTDADLVGDIIGDELQNL